MRASIALSSDTPLVSDTPLLEIRDLSKTFGSVQALTDVDFEVRAGEVMALVGDNGAGKSTLIKCIAGIHGYDSGEIFFDGKPVTIHGPKDAAKLGIEVVYQDLALCDNLDVVQNMYLGREIRDFLFRLKEPAMEQRSAETLKGLRVTTIKSIRQTVATLSGGQRQSVAVARAVMWNSKLVILDEPTAALGVAQTEQVLELVRRLAEQGLAVVLISHNLHDIFETATRITVLRLGRNVGIYERATTTQQEVVQAITAGIPTKVVGHRGDRPGGRRVSTDAEIVAPGIGLPGGDDAEEGTGLWQRTLGNIKSGNLGVLPVVLGEVLIVAYFGFTATNFFTAGNFVNVILQMAGVTMIAYGVVFVLLLGEIDLSIGYLSGIAAVTAADDAARGRAQLPGMARDPDRARGRRGDRRGAGNDRREGRRAVVRRHARRAPDLAGSDPEDPRAARRDHHRDQLDQRCGDVLLLRERRLAHSRDHHRAYTPSSSWAAPSASDVPVCRSARGCRSRSSPASRSRASARSRSATTRRGRPHARRARRSRVNCTPAAWGFRSRRS